MGSSPDRSSILSDRPSPMSTVVMRTGGAATAGEMSGDAAYLTPCPSPAWGAATGWFGCCVASSRRQLKKGGHDARHGCCMLDEIRVRKSHSHTTRCSIGAERTAARVWQGRVAVHLDYAVARYACHSLRRQHRDGGKA